MATADRDIRKVIEQMLASIPADQVDLIARLHWVEKGIAYCPPEHLPDLWATCHHILMEEIGEPKLDWQIAVEAIFSDRK